MKRSLFLLFLLLIFARTTAAQDVQPENSAETALLFGKINELPPINLTPPKEWQIGDRRTFNITAVESGNRFSILTQLIYNGDNLLVWQDLNQNIMINAETEEQFRRFDQEIIPLLRETFGEEDIPGVDNDPRLSAVFSERIGNNYLGYFSAEDLNSPPVYPDSNGMEVIFLNPILLNNNGQMTPDTLSHEFQHLIHNAHDANEDVFLDEGFSGLAEFIGIGEKNDSNIRAYLNDTGKSLTQWPDSVSGNHAYYGSAFLFSMYLYERLGKDGIRAIVDESRNGMDGIDAVTNNNANRLFMEWNGAVLAALRRDDTSAYRYRRYSFPQDGIFRDINELSAGTSAAHEISQYGTDFFHLSCINMPCYIRFHGDETVRVSRLDNGNNTPYWWSQAVNLSRTMLSLPIDLRDVSAPVSLEFDLNYEIETGFDHLYLLVSDANGSNPQVLGSEDEMIEGKFGASFTGSSGKFQRHSIALDSFCGKEILLRFIYLTDTATISDGVALKNLRILVNGKPINAGKDEFWIPDGFIRQNSRIEQPWGILFIRDNQAEFLFDLTSSDFDCSYSDCYIAVSPLSRTARTRSGYSITVN